LKIADEVNSNNLLSGQIWQYQHNDVSSGIVETSILWSVVKMRLTDSLVLLTL